MIANTVLRWVCRRTLLIFEVVEVLLSGFLIWWMIRHKQVAFLGYFVFNWKTYIIFLGVRICIACWGFYVVWIRSVNLVKVWYGLFFFTLFLAIWTVIPIHMLQCQCIDYRQCSALVSFAPKGKMLNPFWEPNLEYFESKRAVPFKPPPSDPRRATIFTEELLDEARAKEDPPSFSLLEHDSKGVLIRRGKETADSDVTMAVESLAYGHGRLVNKRRKVHALAPDQHQDAPERRKTMKDLSTKSGDRRSSMGHQPLRLFNVTRENIVWVGKHDPQCTEHPLAKSKTEMTKTRLAEVRDGEDVEVGRLLTSVLFICAMDTTCGAVSAEVIEDRDAPNDKYKICQHPLQLVPVYRGDVNVPAVAPNSVGPNAVFFQRNPIAIRVHLEQNAANPTKLYKYAFRTVDTAKGVKMLHDIEKDACICDNAQTAGGCNTYTDDLGKNKFWCYVKDWRREACIEEGHTLFWDATTQRIWSEDICAKAGCMCSGLGQYPYDIEDPMLNQTLLHSNYLNYGDDCKKWITDDPHPWCFVGWDSTCPDRSRRRNKWATKSEEEWAQYRIKNQFKSRLAERCRPKDSHLVWEAAHNYCEDVSRAVEFVMLINLLSFLPMTVIIFKFLSNRCGDEFQFEDQFAVVLSTDEDESEDEWASGQTRETKGAAEDEAKAPGGDGAKSSEA